MAKISILSQGLVENQDHHTALTGLLSLPEVEFFIFNIAFVRKGGVEKIKSELKKVNDRVEIYLGIRNGVTSVQGIISLLKVGISPFVVDTATNSKIYHPKVYGAFYSNGAKIIMGSANLTFGGLFQNIETSALLELDKSKHSDNDFINDVVKNSRSMPDKYPEHVFRIESIRQAVSLLKEGRLEDERVATLPPRNPLSKDKKRDSLPPIPTYSKGRPSKEKGIEKPKHVVCGNKGILVWKSKPLSERSLNIPRGHTTNITGDMNLGQGMMTGINFQHYFRDIVFVDLIWEVDPESRSDILERAHINAEIIIKNVSHGVYALEITHDPRTDTRSYEQKNVMTKIRWGNARPIIARRDLLNRILNLYKKDAKNYVITID